jgi:uncharacterized membrane protein YbaN (DUF454 family)
MHHVIHKTAWVIGGVFFLLLALIGLLLPVIPQLSFLIISIFCFMRSSDRFYDWMHRQHWFIRAHDWAQKQHWYQKLKASYHRRFPEK